MRTILLVSCVVFCLPVSGYDQPKKSDKPKLEAEKTDLYDIAGYYECNGKDGGGKKYSGICTIHPVDGVFVVTWVVGPSNFTGIGMQLKNGSKQTLTVGWASAKEGQVSRGVNHYDIHKADKGYRLEGKWCSMPGTGQVHAESLTFLKELDKDE